MNREQRRKAARGAGHDMNTAIITQAYLDKLKKEATDEAVRRAFSLMLGLPVMVLRDKFGFGKVRAERFVDAVLDLYDAFDESYISLEDIHKVLKDELGITIDMR